MREENSVTAKATGKTQTAANAMRQSKANRHTEINVVEIRDPARAGT